jgi:3-hydroxyisobutyrate dehydrogenase
MLNSNTLSQNKEIGIIGLGNLGSSIAERLLNKGLRINTYNRNQTKRKEFENKGAKAFEDPKSLANRCDVIITCVSDFKSLKDIFFEKQGIIESNNSRLIIADCTTIRSDQSIYCSEILKEKKGMTLLSSPVMGGPFDAKNGELIAMVSGNRKAFENIQDILSIISKHTFYLGQKNGIANSLKLALNLNIAAIYLALSEGAILSMHSGIDLHTYIEIFNLSKLKTGISENKGRNIINQDFPPSFYLKHMLKDLDLVMETSKALQISLPITKESQSLFSVANKRSDLKDKDYSAIFQLLSELNKKK